MLKIGLTGGIGSGKSTVAKIFCDLGINIIDTDKISHALTQPGTECFEKITRHFKQNIILQNGNLDRKKLREIVFKNEIDRIWLENILHPLIIKKMLDDINNATSTYCVVVVPLLIEANLTAYFDRILVVETTENLQIQRATERDKSQEENIKRIIHTQASSKQRLSLANDIIYNNDSLVDLVKEVTKLDQIYKKYAAS